MPAAYLHGVEVLPQQSGSRPVSVVLSSVIGIVGIAPRGTAQSLIKVSSATDASQFGVELPGFTIPQAIAAIRANRESTILVVNVYNETTHAVSVTNEVFAISGGKGKLAFPPVQAGYGSTVVIKNNADVVQTWVYGTDYTIDDYGNFTALTTVPTDAANYKASYKKLDPTTVTSSHIIGANTSGVRTGLEMFEEAYSTYGFKAKILIAPGYSTAAAVVSALATKADHFKGMALIDAPAGTSVATALASRGPGGAINFNVANKRLVLLYPGVKTYDTYTNADQVRWYSQYMAGVMSNVHYELGYWNSPSNKTIQGITGMERKITFDPSDQTGTTEANQLNAIGITTIANSFGTGFLTWGNRSSLWPGTTTPDNFINVQTVRDVVEDSIQYNMMQFLDQNIGIGQIDNVVETVNNFIKTLIGRGALIDGSNCLFDPLLNSDVTLAAGQVIFSLDLMAPTPGERLTFLSTLNIALLKNLLKIPTA